MLRKILLISSALFLLSNCGGGGPKISVFISDPKVGGLDGYDEATQKASFVKYADSDKYVCFTPTDAQTLLSSCAQASTSVQEYFDNHPKVKTFLLANGFTIPNDNDEETE